MRIYLVGAAPSALTATLTARVKALEVVGDVDRTALQQANAQDIVLWWPQDVPTVAAGVTFLTGVQAHIGLCTPPQSTALMHARLRQIADETGAMLIDVAGFVQSYATYGDGQQPVATLIARYAWLRLRNWLLPNHWYHKYYYGAATYPEVWGLDVVKHDIQEMQRLHMNFTRIGEFMWQTLEPRPGEYHFELLEQALALYEQAGIDVVVCTPTPTPPRWLTYEHPERCVHNADGTVMSHGSRQHVCTNNPVFRDRAYRVTLALAKVLRRHANVVGVQLDNEFKCHVNQCFCASCQAEWHRWLALRYSTIAQLNESWGTQVWSEAYAAFAEVPMPTATPFLHNASLLNAFQQFTSESVGEFAEGLMHILRQELDVPLMHNSSLGFNVLNRQLFSQLDVVGFDTYAPATQFGAFTINFDMYRNVKADTQDYMLLETSTAHADHIQGYVTPHPQGYLPNEAFLGFASGLRTFEYWLFRQQRFGVEQPHSAVLTAWGEPDINMADVEKTGELFAAMQPELTVTRPVKSTVALMYSDAAKRFYQVDNGGYYNYRQLITRLHQALLKAGIAVELIQESADLTPFSLVFAPFIRHVSPALLRRFEDFCNAGGKLLLGPMTGDRTEELTLPAHNGLDRVGEWLGFSMIRQFSQHDAPLPAHDADGAVALHDVITVFDPPADWQVLVQAPNQQAVYARGAVGAGTVLYLGALPQQLDGAWWQRFMREEILPATATAGLLQLAPGLILYQRDGADFSDYYIANMTPAPAQVTNLAAGFSCETTPVTASTVTVEAFGHTVLRRSKKEATPHVHQTVSRIG